jgi:hypothetical protein
MNTTPPLHHPVKTDFAVQSASLFFCVEIVLFLLYSCGAGTAADTENTTGLISSQLELHRLRTGWYLRR